MRSCHQTVLWDFNGTLVDDLDLVVRTVNAQMAKRGLPTLTVDEYRAVFQFPVEAYYRRIGVDFESESMADLSADFFADYAPALRNCSLYPGVLDALNRIREAGIPQFVLSAMEEGMLRSMIDALGVGGYFTAVYGLAHQEGDSKVERAHALLREQEVDPCDALLVGDTVHDAEVAAAIGATPVLLAQGHQSMDRLKEIGCDVYRSVEAFANEGLRRWLSTRGEGDGRLL